MPTVLRRDHDKIETSRPVVVNGYCPRHNRFLTLRESEAGCCGWCEPDRFEWSPKDRAAIERINTPRAAPDGLTCLECSDPLPAGFKYYCPSCVSARAERAEQEVPL